MAMGITMEDNRADLCGDRLFVEDRGIQMDAAIVWGSRIGISVGTDHPWRAYLAANLAVSARRSSCD